MITYTIPKVKLCFYFDYIIKSNKCYIFQETKDDRVHTNFICNTNKICCEELTHDEENIYIKI